MGSASLEHNCLFAQSKSLRGQQRRPSRPTHQSQIKLNKLIFHEQRKRLRVKEFFDAQPGKIRKPERL